MSTEAPTVEAPIGRLDVRQVLTRAQASRPWTAENLAWLVVANVVGLVVVVSGWYQASNEGVVRTELSWLIVSILGLAVAGVANALWILRCRQALAMARAAVLSPARRAAVLGPVRSPTAVPAADGVAVLVAGPGMSSFHRADCPAVAGKRVHTGTAADFEAAGLHPCGICEP